MSEIYTLFRFEGVTSLVQNNPHHMGGDGDDAPKARKKKYDRKEEVKTSQYRLPDGRVYFPTEAFRLALIEGAVGMKVGSISAIRAVRCVFEDHDHALILDANNGEGPIEKVGEYRKRCVINKAGVMKSRAKFDNWCAYILFEHDTDFISAKVLKDLFNRAGKLVGVGDHRPAKKGRQGRFTCKVATKKQQKMVKDAAFLI